MVHVAREMKREHFDLPLLIGGATTSVKHTAVKIAPCYDGPVIHVKDASRSVGVVDRLGRKESREEFDRDNREVQEAERKSFGRRQERKLVPYEQALKRRFQTDWTTVDIPKPSFLGKKVLREVPLADLVPFIDWSPFFSTWELKGKYPKILDDPTIGSMARELFDNAQKLLDRLVTRKQLTANAVYGFFPANSEGDDIQLYTDDNRDHAPGAILSAPAAVGATRAERLQIPRRLYRPEGLRTR